MALFGVGSLPSLPATAQQSQNWQWCSGRGSPTPDQRLSACSAIIASGGETRENRARAHDYRGVAYQNKGERDRALRDYEESVALDPASASSHRVRGNIYKLNGDLDRAIAAYDEAIRLDPNDARAVLNRGGTYYQKKEYDRAVADCSEAIRLDPAFTLAFYSRGMAYRAKRDLVRAVADFDEAIRLEPGFAEAFDSRGLTHVDQKRYDRAIADYNEAIRLDRNNVTTILHRGYASYQNKEYDRAIADYTEALAMQPRGQSIASAFTGRCWARFAVGRDLQDALADCTSALNLLPNDTSTLNARGFTYLKLGEFDRAIADFDAVLAINARSAMSLYGRGLARQKTGDSLAAGKDLEMAKSIWGDVAKVFATEFGLQ